MDRYERRLLAYITVLALVMLAGVAGFSLLEGFSPFDSLYLTIVTIATVGYGDLHPVTAGGKVLSIALIIGGVGCFVGLVANALEHLTYRQEREHRRKRTNLLVGLFFSQLGTALLATFSRGDAAREDLFRLLADPEAFSTDRLPRLLADLGSRTFGLDSHGFDLERLRDTLGRRLDVLSMLLQNPDLEEHSRFSDLLQALLHLWQELEHREVLIGLPDSDMAHLSGDLNRVYGLLVLEWAVYMGHLKVHYPYLYSLALRTNPFDEKASVIVRE
ncbi:MAG: potassium channel family protein [Methanolinea sp.]|nr:potassium channel family protein [Methanolinea sp.]